jgi:DNA-binding NarL/FixJ family response regulator
MTIRILLADDHKIVRDGLKTLVEKQPEMEVIGEAENGREAVRLAMKLKPKVVIMDVSMADLNGMEAARQIRKEYPEIKIIALSMHSDKRFVLGMLEAGASGYLLKDCAFEELSRAIRNVVAHQTYLSPGVTDVVVQEYLLKASKEKSPGDSILTSREREVLQLIAEGKSTKETAKILHVSIKTIETHRKQIMDKLDLHSIAELTKYALREGLTSLDS